MLLLQRRRIAAAFLHGTHKYGESGEDKVGAEARSQPIGGDEVSKAQVGSHLSLGRARQRPQRQKLRVERRRESAQKPRLRTEEADPATLSERMQHCLVQRL